MQLSNRSEALQFTSNPNIGSGAAPGIQFSTSEREPPWGGQC